MGRLDTFVAPQPNKTVIGAMKHVNRLVMLRGLPLLRDVPGLNRFPPFRGLANIREFDFPEADKQRLKAHVGQGKATFFTPNHPEFFTDWMVDKELISRVAPMAASWATNGIVNGMGSLGQKFWLANNLIAQIPGNSDAAREHSIEWALQGHGVLLHPEGAVGWHSDYVAPLMPGAIEMGLEALERGRKQNPDFEVWIAPFVSKLVFLRDVERELARECAYVERKLSIERRGADALPARIHHIYSTLLDRDEVRFGITVDDRAGYAARKQAVAAAISNQVAVAIGAASGEADMARAVRRWMRENKESASFRQVKQLADALACLNRLGPFAFEDETITQEHLAEHLKRLRTDYCKGTLRDTLGALLPQPAGPRRAVIRVPEPIALHTFKGSEDEAVQMLRSRLQATLDAINAELAEQGAFRTYANPFYEAAPARSKLVA